MESKKIVAVIDVGTLKSKFEIREFDENFNSKVLYKDKQLTVMGRDLPKTNNMIIEKSILKTIEALNMFKDKMTEYKVEKYLAVTTEAIRKATNSEEVLNRIEESTGIKLEVLSQKDEARLLFESVSKDFPDQEIAVADIGGGSVQVVIGENTKIHETYLFKSGTYFMQEEFSESHHPAAEELQTAIDYVRTELKGLGESKRNPKVIVYGTTNIIEFLETMNVDLEDREGLQGDHPYSIDVAKLRPLYDKIIALSYEDRMPMYEKEPYYMWAADKALMNIFQISEYLNCRIIVPSNNNISSGILYDLAKSL